MNTVVCIGRGTLEAAEAAKYQQISDMLAQQLGVLVELSFFEFNTPAPIDAVLACLRRGATQVTLLPLLVTMSLAERSTIQRLLNWLNTTYPQIRFSCAEPLHGQQLLLQALAEQLPRPMAATTAILFVGHIDAHDQTSASEIARVARLFADQQPKRWVEYAFAGMTRPNLSEGIERCVRLGAHQIIVLPYWLFADRMYRFIDQQLQSLQARHPALPLVLPPALGAQSDIAAALLERYQATQQSALPQQPLPTHRSTPSAASILPVRYQGNVVVSAAPMAAADLQYDHEGRVAWDQIWGSDDPESPFCALALAGGPPHRGELLEPVSVDQVQADWEGYTRVVLELVRGIGMTTGLYSVMSRTPGWVGVQCEDEAMAIWLLRAIVVENVCVRREGSILFVPAGPDFRLEYEIKNVITVLAKTHHYWKEHRH
jgi:sirohydrochlorin cobaltochelatase